VNNQGTEPGVVTSVNPPPLFRVGLGRIVILGAFVAFYQFYNMMVNPPCVRGFWFQELCEPRPREHYYPAVLLIYGGGFALLYAVYQFVRRRRAYALGVVLGVVLSVVMFYIATMIHWFLE